MEQARSLGLSAYNAAFQFLLSLVEKELVPGACLKVCLLRINLLHAMPPVHFGLVEAQLPKANGVMQ